MTDTKQLFFDAERRAERLLGWVRVAISLILAVLFAATVLRELTTADPILRRQLSLAALTMAGYLVIGLISLTAARREVFRTWHTWTFATCDVGFVLLSLYIGLINTGADANYLTSLPAAWLIPLVLAFGALRFNPFQQAYVTALIGLGLAVIALWAVSWVDASTHAFPDGLNRLFEAPPNIMRLGMIVLAGVILTVAVYRTRQFLTRALEENRRRIHLTRYLPPELSDELSDKGTAELRSGQRRRVAVLFVDVRGFTHRSEGLSPAALSNFVTRFRRCVTDAAAAHSGIVDKFIGDAALVVFGLTDDAGNHGRNAIACAQQLQANVETWNREPGPKCAPVEVGVGIHWGEVFCGAVGDDKRLEFTVLGDTVNVAARIEELTKSVQSWLIVSGELLSIAGEAEEDGWQPVEQTTLRGRDKPIKLFQPR
ncbi:adenylate/guanylate cyclase domain-containing protein [Pelagibius sp. Alg239-R121]|uniref:adenylate/guanylate cyclase domain-containing protein n=1 Tax=Pelagibius sp. Alg239-R121 TaxID=2993448 RepID=UPI0024A76AE2|nr:adenylate/guanylate cyclase domain-containing protein [Pelagibius sp. Alg239-R121]